MTPVIGIPLDCETGGADQYSKFPWYAVRQNYISAVVKAGGLPLLLPHEPSLLNIYLDDIDGLLITGGNFDVDPSLYGQDTVHDTVSTKDGRTAFEMAMLQGALKRDVPVLGICGGQQLLQVALGGTLVQHIPDTFPGGLAHEQPNPRDEVGHDVEIFSDTLLHRIVGETHIQVNSAHHQAALDEPTGVRINARAPDGVIEGCEATNMSFCLGVQWHPEFEITTADTRIMAAFVEAARIYAIGRENTHD